MRAAAAFAQWRKLFPEGLWWFVLLAGVLLALAGCGSRDPNVVRPTGDYYATFVGQWTGSGYHGGADWEKHWALSLARDYSVFVRTPEGQVFRGTAEMRFDLGADDKGRIRMPPGSTLLDIRIDEGPQPSHAGRYLLGAMARNDRVLIPKNVHNACLGEPGENVRAISFTETVKGVRCFELYSVSGEVAAQIEQMAGRRARDGKWHISKVRDAPAYLQAQAYILGRVSTAYGLIMATLFTVALLYWTLRGEAPDPSMALSVRLFPYVGPRIRIALWRALLAAMLFAALPLLLFFFPHFVIIVIAYHAYSRLSHRAKPGQSDDGSALLHKLGALSLALVVGLGLLAPANLLLVGIYHALGQPADGVLIDLVATSYARSMNRWAALAGAGAVAIFIAADAFWRLRQAKTVDNLATSGAASASHGLVELAGVARPARGVPADGLELLRWTQTTSDADSHIEPFDLEDASGTIRIDPRGASFNPGWIGNLLHVFAGFHEIALTRRVVVDEAHDRVTRTLSTGDRVYVIGHVRWQRDEATGREMRVVGLRGAPLASPLRRLLGGAQSAHDVFFLSDSDEAQARAHLLRGARRVWLLSLAWLAASSLLYWSAS